MTTPFFQTAVFRDRREAGRALGRALQGRRAWTDPLVLALPRGGVPIGFEAAQAIGAALDILVVRKIGHPSHEEFAIGAIAAGGVSVMNPQTERYLGGVAPEDLERIVQRETLELQRREALYRGGEPAQRVAHRDVIVVDDGLATGATMRAAVMALRRLAPASITVGVPLGPRETCDELRQLADDVVCVETPEPFYAVGSWYGSFPQVEDDEVTELLRSAHQHA
jgi:predicted phosphoribosyltransferase